MIHENCNGEILVDVTSSYKLLARVAIGKGGSSLSTAEIHVWNTKEQCSELIFWCVKCDAEVSLSEVVMSCRNCGHTFHAEDGVLPLETGGTWCSSCAEDRCDGEDCQCLETILENGSVKLT